MSAVIAQIGLPCEKILLSCSKKQEDVCSLADRPLKGHTMSIRNLFGRRTPKQSPQIEAPQILDVEVFEEHRKNYVSFCDGSIPHAELEVDFLRLVTDPRIAAVTFSKSMDEFLMYVGTTLVTIRNPHTKKLHEIGEFVITIDRKSNSVYFENITRTVGSKDEPGKRFPHPHIFDYGEMCMSMGNDVMHEHLGKGEVYSSVRYMLAGLWRVDSGQIGSANIKNWPIIEG
jgi:hypothetical protein